MTIIIVSNFYGIFLLIIRNRIEVKLGRSRKGKHLRSLGSGEPSANKVKSISPAIIIVPKNGSAVQKEFGKIAVIMCI